MFAKIKSVEDAHDMIKSASLVMYFVAATQVFIAFFATPMAIIDAIAFAVLGYFLNKFKSIVPAILCLMLSLISAYFTITNKINAMNGIQEGGTNILLSLIVLIISVRSVEAAYKYKKMITNTTLANE